MKLHKALATEVVTRLYAAYQERKGLFALVTAEDAPQHVHIPKDVAPGTLTHLRWLFFAVMTDRRQVSDGVYRAHVDLYDSHPDFYDERVLAMSEAHILEHIKDKRIGLPNQSAGYWKRCGASLFNIWDGDPRTMYHQRSIDDLMQWKRRVERETKVDPMPGYGPKIMSLLAIFLEELGMEGVPDALPVDVHVQRFFLANNLITLNAPVNNVWMEKTIRPFLTDLCAKHGWKRPDLAHALWLLGNRVCTTCAKKADAELLCPSYATCRGAPETKTYFVEGVWRPKFTRMRKGGEMKFQVVGPLFGGK